MEPAEIPGPDGAWKAAERFAATSERRGEDPGDLEALRHLLAWGTPIAINLHTCEGASLDDVDARLRERSGGRLTLHPGPRA